MSAVIHEDLYDLMRVRGYTGGFYLDALAAIDIALWDICRQARRPAAGQAARRAASRADPGLRLGPAEGRPAASARRSRRNGRRRASRSFKFASPVADDGVVAEIETLARAARAEARASPATCIGRTPPRRPSRSIQRDGAARALVRRGAGAQPEDIDGLGACRRPRLDRRSRPARNGAPCSTWCRGSHAGPARIVQPEMGHNGVTEFMRIGLYAQAHHLKVIPHATIGIGIFLAASLQPAPRLRSVDCHEFQHSIFEPEPPAARSATWIVEQAAYTPADGSGPRRRTVRRGACAFSKNHDAKVDREEHMRRNLEIAVCRPPSLLLGRGARRAAFAQTKVLKFVSWQKDEKRRRRLVGHASSRSSRTKHPGVKIEWTKVERGAYADTMTTLFAGGKPPDIVHLASFEFQEFADNGWLENLGPWIKKSKLDLKGWAGQDNCVWKEQTVCIMMLYFGYIMAYNEDMLEEGGRGGSEELGRVPRRGAQDHQGPERRRHRRPVRHRPRDQGRRRPVSRRDDQLPARRRRGWTNADGKVTINTPQMIEGLNRWKTVVKESLTPRDLSAGEMRQMFADGKIAMKIDGPWLYPIMQRAKPEVDQTKMRRRRSIRRSAASSNVLAMASRHLRREQEAGLGLHRDRDLRQVPVELRDARRFAAAEPARRHRPRPRRRRRISTCWCRRSSAAAKAQRRPHPRWGWRSQFNEFAKMVMEEVQRMIIQDLDPPGRRQDDAAEGRGAQKHGSRRIRVCCDRLAQRSRRQAILADA